jgi:uncharacterized protein DUF6962
MPILEPATMITDYVLALASLGFGASLLRLRSRDRTVPPLLWAIGFFVAAAAAVAGGTYHGFALSFSAAGHRAMWNVTMLLIGASVGLFVAAILTMRKSLTEHRNWLKAGVLLSMFGLVVQQSGWSFFQNFNHNDLYHCIQIVAFYLFFRAAEAVA